MTGDRRVLRTEGWRIVQVRQLDGSWWNIRIDRDTTHAQRSPRP